MLSPRMEEPGGLALALGAFVAFVVLALGLNTIGFATALGMGNMQGVWLIALPALFLGAFLSWTSERMFVYIAILGHAFVLFTSTNEGIAAADFGFAGITLAGIIVWFAKEMMVHRNVVMRTEFDVLLMGIFISTTIVAFIGNRLHDGDMLWYVLEWTKPFDLLLYYPIRKITNSRKDVVKLIAVFSILALTTGIVGMITYRERLMKAVFAYQIESSRIFTNEPVLMIFAIMSTVIVAYARRRRTLLLGVGMTVLGLLFLIITYSRGAIGSAFVGILVVIVLATKGRRVVLALLFAAVMGAAGVYALYPNIARTMAISVGKRIGTIGAATTDVSFNLRVLEAEAILERYFPHSPIIGHGYGVTYHWFDPTVHHTLEMTFIHNGYVKLLFKYGVPITVLFLLFMAYPLVRVAIRSPSRRDEPTHAMMVGTVAYLVCALVNNYVSDMYSNYVGPLNFALCWAILDYVNRQTLPARSPTLLPEPPSEPLAVAGV